RAHRPDVAIIDIRMPPAQLDEGLHAARAIRAELPEVGVLLLSQHVEERYAVELLEYGADGVGYLLKERVTDIAHFVEAVRQVAARRSVLDPEVVAHMMGRRRRGHALDALSERDREVLALRFGGDMTGPEIAKLLNLSLANVQQILSRSLRRLRKRLEGGELDRAAGRGAGSGTRPTTR
ncbi:MAG TPA: response regulator transcription factor, partial [Solirubrobacterales bacterium]|nr:response regulator transcription factor [Solirubrobacterales bacterium]